MNANEIVRALKECGDCDTCPYYDCWIDEHTGDPADACDEGRLFRDVIALIESLQAQLAEKIHIKLRTDEDMLTPKEAIETINRLRKAYRKTTAQLAASQRRERAAVDALEGLMKSVSGAEACVLCSKDHTSACRIDWIPPRCEPTWVGSQEAGEGA